MKDITFKEFNLDGKMKGYVRNISVKVGDIPMLEIQYHPPQILYQRKLGFLLLGI